MAKLYVHRNLNRSCWSILHLGKLQEYRNRLTLRDVEFRVRPGGYRRALREGRRNVHAFAVGRMGRKLPPTRPVRVRYDRAQGEFVNSKSQPVFGAEAARLRDDGTVWAYRPRYTHGN